MAKSPNEDILQLILDRLDSSMERGDKLYADATEKLDQLAATAVRQQVILEEHMRRTAANEALLAEMRTSHEKQFQEVNHQMEPLKAHVAMWGGAGKVLAVLAAVGTIAAAAFKIFNQ